MTFYYSERFRKAYHTLSPEIQKLTDEKLRLLASSWRHPSLHTKRIQGTKDIWEARISLNYRMTFQKIKEGIFLRNLGPHDPTLRKP